MDKEILDKLTGVPPEGVPWDASIIITFIAGGLLCLAAMFAIRAGKELMHFWVTSPDAKGLNFFQLIAGVFWSHSFNKSTYPKLNYVESNARYAFILLVIFVMVISISRTLGMEMLNEIFGFSNA